MPIYVAWNNDDKTIVTYQFTGIWTWDDFDAAVEKGFILTESVKHTVHVIVDFQRSQTLPDGMLIYARRVMRVLPANQGHIVIVGDLPELRTLSRMFKSVFRSHASRFSRVDDLSEVGAELQMKELAISA